MSRREELDETLWPSEPRTLIKHQIYRHYLQCWMGKILQVDWWPAATIVDAFAGPGRYMGAREGEEGPDGSPLVIAKTWLEHSHRERFVIPLTILCCEKRPDRVEHLRSEFARLDTDPARLKLEVLDATSFTAASQSAIRARAHQAAADEPVLWVLDPFDTKSLPMELVQACLHGKRDEVLITWFSDDVYRFMRDPTKDESRDRYFGVPSWRDALVERTEGKAKAVLLAAYQRGLRSSLATTLTNAVELGSKNESARYAVIFATHHPKGMECFNPTAWRLDRFSGQRVNEFKVDQIDMFEEQPDYAPLRAAFMPRAGSAARFDALVAQALRLGFTEAQVRTVLGELAQDGLAVRQKPLESRTDWPEGCLVRFYEGSATD